MWDCHKNHGLQVWSDLATPIGYNYIASHGWLHIAAIEYFPIEYMLTRLRSLSEEGIDFQSVRAVCCCVHFSDGCLCSWDHITDSCGHLSLTWTLRQHWPITSLVALLTDRLHLKTLFNVWQLTVVMMHTLLFSFSIMNAYWLSSTSFLLLLPTVLRIMLIKRCVNVRGPSCSKK